MKKSLFGSLAIALASLALLSPSAFAGKPNAWLPSPGNQIIISALSDNGLWGLSETAGDLDTDNPQVAGGTLLDIANKTLININPGSTGRANVNDVTDDGEIVVGAADGFPAFWTKSTGKWTKLPLVSGYNNGQILAVTPDGHYGVGFVGLNSDIMVSAPVLYDLTTKKIIDLPNMPTKAMNGVDYRQSTPRAISPDGRYIVGLVAESYMMDNGQTPPWAYIYDREDTSDHPYRALGFNIEVKQNKITKEFYDEFLPINEGSNFVDCIKMSPNGKYVTGVMRMAKPIPGSMFNDDYIVPFRYTIATNSFELFDTPDNRDIGGFAIDDNGVIYGAAPWDSPYPSAAVQSGRYFYTFDQIFSQVFNYNLMSAIGEDITGKPMAISGDGLTISLRTGEHTGYMLSLTDDLAKAAEQVDLLGNYIFDPMSGASFAKAKSFTLTFDREIAFNGDHTRIKLLKSDGSTLLSALSASVPESNSRQLAIGFRTTQLADGETYTLYIPAGLITLKNDNTIKAKDIRATYTGRGNAPVKPTYIYPGDDATVAFLDSSTNPLLITFDAVISIADNAPEVYLYEEGYNTPKAQLIASTNGNLLQLYPISAQYLFDGVDYRVEIPEGLITDLSGSGANQAISLNYHGVYVRELNPDDIYIFRADGATTDYLKFITFDGDEQEPAETPAAWGFTAATPWWGVLGSETSTDLSFASHSMYATPGKSDDWMMTPQLYVPDEEVVLEFDVQGYKKNKKDRLNVYIYESIDGINSLNHELATLIRNNAELIYSEIASPGATEEGLDNEWTHVAIKLDKYAGKFIYIAFVNENDNQSAIFLDNVHVMHNTLYTLSFMHATTMVAAKNVKVEGRLQIKDSTTKYSKVEITLYDSNKNLLGTNTFADGPYSEGSTISFSFDKPLNLVAGEINTFSIGVALDDNEPAFHSDAIKNMLFEPTKRVVLEEFTGSECGNCPLGIRAIDNLLSLYPKNFLPITLRCYSGDFLGTNVQDYAAYLGLQAAPTGLINRRPDVYSPMIDVQGDYRFSAAGVVDEQGIEQAVWLDIVNQELQTLADADVEFAVNYDASTRQLEIPITVRYALNMSSQALKLLAVILEDQLMTYQVNYFTLVDDTDLLPWSKGGSLCDSPVVYNFDDVARGWIGQNPGGTAGLLPSTLKAGTDYSATLTGKLPDAIEDSKVQQSKVVVMLLDDKTGRVINANIAKVGSHTDSVEDSILDTSDINISLDGRTITATANGPIALQVYTLTGQLLANVHGNSHVSTEIDILNTPLIVRVQSGTAARTAKLIVR